MKIQYLANGKIDKKQWDTSIQRANNALVYGTSDFLDIACPGWDALVTPDYKYILPLPRRKKYGLPYIPKVIYLQKSAIFSQEPVGPEMVSEFLKAVPKKFLKVNLNLDYNFIPNVKSYTFRLRKTQELDMKADYEKLFKNFSKSHKKNIRKARKKGIRIKLHRETEDVVKMQSRVFQRKEIYTQNNPARILSELLEFSQKNNPPLVYSAYSDGRLCAAAYFMRFGKRYTIFSGADAEGRKTQAGFLIINEFLKQHAGEAAVLDFAGSEIKGVAQRNSGFGAQNRNYLSAKRNFKLL